MFTLIGAKPYTGYTGTTTFTSLEVIGKFKSGEIEQAVHDNFDECAGLMLVLNAAGEEADYDEYNGKFIES